MCYVKHKLTDALSAARAVYAKASRGGTSTGQPPSDDRDEGSEDKGIPDKQDQVPPGSNVGSTPTAGTGECSFSTLSLQDDSGHSNASKRLLEVKMRLLTDDSLEKNFGHIYSSQLMSYLMSGGGLQDLTGSSCSVTRSIQHPDLFSDLMCRPPGSDSDLLLAHLHNDGF